MADVRKLLGARIKLLRERAGLSQAQLGGLCDLDKQSVWRLESGQSWPQYVNLEKIAQAFKIDTGDLFVELTEPPKDHGIPRKLLQRLAASDEDELAMLLRVLEPDEDGDWDVEAEDEELERKRGHKA